MLEDIRDLFLRRVELHDAPPSCSLWRSSHSFIRESCIFWEDGPLRSFYQLGPTENADQRPGTSMVQHFGECSTFCLNIRHYSDIKETCECDCYFLIREMVYGRRRESNQQPKQSPLLLGSPGFSPPSPSCLNLSVSHSLNP